MTRTTVQWLASRMALIIALIAFAIVLSICTWRLLQHWPEHQQGTPERWALASYRDATYYPIRAVLDGVNPYDSRKSTDPDRYMQRYPVADHFPLYSPLMLVLFAPLGCLSPDASMIAFAILNTALLILLTYVALRVMDLPRTLASVVGLATLLLISQVGRSVFNSGQVAIPLALFSWGMLGYSIKQPNIAVLATILNTLKPTYGGPIGLLLMAAGQSRIAIRGLLIGGLVALIGMSLIFARGGDTSMEQVRAVLLGNNEHFQNDPEVVTSTNHGRVDTAAAIEYLINQKLPAGITLGLTLSILGLTAAVLWHGRQRLPLQGASDLPATLILLASVLCIYHNIYDGMILVLPLLAVLFSQQPSWQTLTNLQRRWLGILLLVPFYNPLWSPGFTDWLIEQQFLAAPVVEELKRLAAAANGLLWTSAWAGLLVAYVRQCRGLQPGKQRHNTA